MKIDGRQITQDIKDNLKIKIKNLKKSGISPHLIVIFIGNDPGSLVYVRQKQKVGDELGINVIVFQTNSDQDTWKITQNQLDKKVSVKDTSDGGRTTTVTPARWRNLKQGLLFLVNKLNNDPSIHGIIIQRPIPIDISKEELNNIVRPEKDVDGFHPKSSFDPPIALAVIRILIWIFQREFGFGHSRESGNPDSKEEWIPGQARDDKYYYDSRMHIWLRTKKILIIGRGETAGKPIANYLENNNIKFKVAHSKTTELNKLCLNSDIIISCVGRSNIIRSDIVSNKSIVIGVGLHPDNDKLQADYDQDKISQKARYFTPVPGGVGPVNVACLMENVVKAADISKFK